MKVTYEQYRKDHCSMCGSQRCDGSDEMMRHCRPFREANLQGICRSCIRSVWCENADRWLDMQYCNQYIHLAGYSNG